MKRAFPGHDETTVRPYYPKGPLSKPQQALFVVSAEFALADGLLMYGYLTPPLKRTRAWEQFSPLLSQNGDRSRFGAVCSPLARKN